MRLAILLTLLLSACSGNTLPAPTGGVFAFNPGQWTPATADMAVPPRVRQ